MAPGASREWFEARGDFIDGAFRVPGRADGEIALEDPGDRDSLAGTFPYAHDSVERAVEAARRAWPGWRDASPESRFTPLRRFAREIASERERLAEMIAREVGKPLWEAREEVDLLPKKIEITLTEGLASVRERLIALGEGRFGASRFHPRGVAAILGPFNLPLHLIHGHAVPALATGNTVIIKPSELAPAVAQHYARLAERSGFPPGVFNLIQGDGGQGERLARHPGVDAALFTGSHAVGRRLLEVTSDQHDKIVVLEMGGKNGAVVAGDADLAAAADAVAYGCAVTAGQRCASTSRVILERCIASAFLERLIPRLRNITVGYALDAGVFMGPLISEAARLRHASIGLAAAREGAETLLKGGPAEASRRGHYVRPSVHLATSCDPAGPYLREEHFVPDLAVIVVDDFDAALARLDETDYGLVGSIFSGNRAQFDLALRRTRLGCLNWNAPTVNASSRLPFGGRKRSGNDRPAGILSTAYCTYPVASIECEAPADFASVPGFAADR
jgi:succinylglutamic semialdehyde dehydrogenase